MLVILLGFCFERRIDLKKQQYQKENESTKKTKNYL